MKASTFIGNVIKSGQLAVFVRDEKVLQVKAENKKFEIDAVNKEFVKDTLGTWENGKSVLGRLTEFRKIATELKDEGITVKLSYQGDTVVTAGLEANPKLSNLVTGTKAIEINNLLKLIELAV
ncbi:TPA: hypothetical protein HA274_01310 [Candidatus Bathyarchaeota archaeon]|nr:hypothetical protein [Candidatus Bathyarchaeota archaeon]